MPSINLDLCSGCTRDSYWYYSSRQGKHEGRAGARMGRPCALEKIGDGAWPPSVGAVGSGCCPAEADGGRGGERGEVVREAKGRYSAPPSAEKLGWPLLAQARAPYSVRVWVCV